MNRLRVSVWVVLLSAALDAEAAVKLDPCGLLARSEIEAVQGDRVVATKASEPERDRFAVSQCFYTLATFSKSVSLEVTRRRPGSADSPREHWRQMFARALEKGKDEQEQAEPEKKTARPRRVSGVGDEAFWDGSSLGGGLLVLKGDAYFRLSVGGPDSESVKIEKLKKLSRRALSRLPA